MQQSKLMIKVPAPIAKAMTLLVVVGTTHFLGAVEVAQERPWDWREVAIGGGGWVTGIEISQQTPNRVVVRTDVGGAFLWSEQEAQWIPFAVGTDPEEAFQQHADDFTSVSGLSFDPSNDKVIYFSAGAYMADWGRPGRLYKSVDGGVTFADSTPLQWTSAASPVRLAGNDGDARFAGERIVVCPRNSKLIFVGTPLDGLWKSDDSGSPTSWTQTNLPNGRKNGGLGVTSLSWSPSEGGRLFAAVYGEGIFFTEDDGVTWNRLDASPVCPMRIVAVADDLLWVAADDGLWKWQAGKWINFSAKTEPGRFTAIAVDPNDANRVVAASGVARKWKETFYRTSDGGQTWERVVWEVERKEETWMPKNAIATAPTDLAFDRFIPNRVWMAHGFGASRTDDIFAATVKWQDINRGIEEVCVFDLAAPPGTPLMSSIADITGFVHDRGLNDFPTSKLMDRPFHERYMDSTGFAFSKQVSTSGYPEIIYRGAHGRDWKIKQPGKDHRLRALMKSTDGGATWSKVNEWFAGGGVANNGYPIRIEVSAGNPNHLFCAFDGYYAYSRDGGESWSASTGTPGAIGGPWIYTFPIGSDQVDPDVFYIFNKGIFAASQDGGKSFKVSESSLPKLSPSKDFVKVCGDPVKAGKVWLGLASRFDRRDEHNGGLFLSDDYGTTFRKVPKVGEVIGFDFGAPETQTSPRPLYLYGWIEGKKGMWTSLDEGTTWTQIDNSSRSLAKARFVTASEDEFGLVFIGTNGSGILRGKMSGTAKSKAWENSPMSPGAVTFRDRIPLTKKSK